MSSGDRRAVTVEAPASSANLGPGFDALALALSLPLRVSVERLEEGQNELRASGEGADSIGADGSNRFLVGLERGLREAGRPAEGPWRITIHNRIPVARGLGSSAAATVCGLLAAEVLSGATFGGERLLRLAAEIEGHADNAAAALLGGFVVVSGDLWAGWQAVRLEPPPGLRVVLYVPEAASRTSEMRAVLPRHVPHADATGSVGRAATIVAAMATGRLEMLSAMYDDRLHEPYRATALPELQALKAAAREAGAVGAALSGAGSSVIALCDSGDVAAAVEAALSEAGRRAELAGRALRVDVEARAARVVD